MALGEGRRARIARGLRSMGFTPTEDNIEQMSVFADALDIYNARERVRGGLWKAFSVEDAATHVMSKGKRMKNAAGSLQIAQDQEGVGEEVMVAYDNELHDSALDAINYAAFAERHRQAGRLIEEDPT